jgi:hypothetical protein
MCIEAAPARIEPPLRPALPARSTAGLQQQQDRQPLLRAAHAAADRQRQTLFLVFKVLPFEQKTFLE